MNAIFKLFLTVLMVTMPLAAHAERIKDLASIQGVRDNQLLGYGLVVGLDGSGRPDHADAVYHTKYHQHVDKYGGYSAAGNASSMHVEKRGGGDGNGHFAAICASGANYRCHRFVDW